jgi:hypothetical protein
LKLWKKNVPKKVTLDFRNYENGIYSISDPKIFVSVVFRGAGAYYGYAWATQAHLQDVYEVGVLMMSTMGRDKMGLAVISYRIEGLATNDLQG